MRRNCRRVVGSATGAPPVPTELVDGAYRAPSPSRPHVLTYQFHTPGSDCGYPAQMSVPWAATPLLLKNSFTQLLRCVGHLLVADVGRGVLGALRADSWCSSLSRNLLQDWSVVGAVSIDGRAQELPCLFCGAAVLQLVEHERHGFISIVVDTVVQPLTGDLADPRVVILRAVEPVRMEFVRENPYRDQRAPATPRQVPQRRP